MSFFEKYEKLIKFVTAVSVPVLYLQGVAYYQGKLSGYGVPSRFYPIGFEQSLSEAFFFYFETIPYLFVLGGIWLIAETISSYYGDVITCKIKRLLSGKLEIFVKKVANFILEHKSRYVVPGFILFSAYALCVLGIAVVVPYLLGLKISNEKFEDLIKSESLNYQKIYIKDSDEKNAYIINLSDKFISFYDGDDLLTYPTSEVKFLKKEIDKVEIK